MDIKDVDGFDGFSGRASIDLDYARHFSEVSRHFKSVVRIGFEIEGNSSLPKTINCPRCGQEVTIHEYEQLHRIIHYLIHNGKHHALKQAIKIYWDGSVDTELVTQPLRIDDIKPVLTFFMGLLQTFGVSMSPDTRAGGHQTISVGERLPDVYLANIEQLSRRFAPTLTRVACSPYDTYRRSTRFRVLNESPIHHYPLDGWEEKYRFVHFKDYETVTGIEFRYPDVLPPEYNYVSAILNMALVWKAIKITNRYRKVITWKNVIIREQKNAYHTMIDDSTYVGDDYEEYHVADNYEWLRYYNTHDTIVDAEIDGHWWYRREDDDTLFKLLRPEIEALTGDYDEWYKHVYNYSEMLNYRVDDFDYSTIECEKFAEDDGIDLNIEEEPPRRIRVIGRVL